MKSKKGTWSQALISFSIPLLIIGLIRWAVFEPFVIPSGSMLPGLQIHDHILVQKWNLGLKIPFTDTWLIQWSKPQRGEVLVFKYPQNPSVYYIKRVVGTPGDRVEFENGEITVNSKKWEQVKIESPADADPGFDYFRETTSEGRVHTVRYRGYGLKSAEKISIQLGNGEYYVFGDNRDESMDSRYWGVVKNHQLVAVAWKVLIGCFATLESNAMLCDPSTLRRERFWLDISKM